MAVDEDRYPVSQALDIIASRLAEGWALLGLEGLWVEEGSVRPVPTAPRPPRSLTAPQYVQLQVQGWWTQDSG
jgi:hypothetical protein